MFYILQLGALRATFVRCSDVVDHITSSSPLERLWMSCLRQVPPIITFLSEALRLYKLKVIIYVSLYSLITDKSRSGRELRRKGIARHECKDSSPKYRTPLATFSP